MFQRFFAKAQSQQPQVRWELVTQVDAYDRPVSTHQVVAIHTNGARQVVGEFTNSQDAWAELKRLAR